MVLPWQRGGRVGHCRVSLFSFARVPVNSPGGHSGLRPAAAVGALRSSPSIIRPMAPAPYPGRACVIGAGPSGIAAAKALHERGIPFDCFERRSRVGGLWAITDGEVQASYPSLECNTSKRKTEFSDFPMPKDYPPYPHNTEMAAYFEAYVDRFGFRDRITLNPLVEHAERSAEGTCAGAGKARATPQPGLSQTPPPGGPAGQTRRSRVSSRAGRCTRTTS